MTFSPIDQKLTECVREVGRIFSPILSETNTQIDFFSVKNVHTRRWIVNKRRNEMRLSRSESNNIAFGRGPGSLGLRRSPIPLCRKPVPIPHLMRPMPCTLWALIKTRYFYVKIQCRTEQNSREFSQDFINSQVTHRCGRYLQRKNGLEAQQT